MSGETASGRSPFDPTSNALVLDASPDYDRGMLKRMGIAGLALLLAPVNALANPRAGILGRLDMRALELTRSPRSDLRGELTVGALVRAGIGTRKLPVLYAAGLDYRLGLGVPASFAYEAHLLPLGLGVVAGDRALLLLTTGVGVSGATGLIAPSASLPLDVRLELDLPGLLHGSAWFRPAWLAATERRDGAPSSRWADELALGFGLRVGREDDKWYGRFGTGLFIGTELVERAGSRGVGIVIGHALDGIVRP